jgi:hypothetical protein
MSSKTGGFKVNGLMISSNSKTGLSLNVDSCTPTPWCARHCYRRWRTKEVIEEMGWDDTSVNTGPVTWRIQQESYRRNEQRIIELMAEGKLEETAVAVAEALKKREVTRLRGNGTGDLFPELTLFYCFLAREGIKVFGFSRKPVELRAMADCCAEMKIPPEARPYFMGSTDPTTTLHELGELIQATVYLNGAAALAYATAAGGKAGFQEVQHHPALTHVKVVFGYHSNSKKTIVGHPLECPSTAGRKIKCDECRCCYGGRR